MHAQKSQDLRRGFAVRVIGMNVIPTLLTLKQIFLPLTRLSASLFSLAELFLEMWQPPFNKQQKVWGRHRRVT